jgi:hypothetical protein
MKREIISAKTLVLLICLTIITSVLSYFTYVNIIKMKYDYDRNTFTFNNVDFDYIIPTPAKSQIQDLINQDSIIHVLPFYATEAEVQDQEIQILMINDIEEYNLTHFSNESKIKLNNIDSDSAIIDVKTAINLGVSIGDNISINISNIMYEYTINGVFKDNAFLGQDLKGTIIVQTPQEIFNDDSYIYSGAYIVSSNTMLTWNYLQNYAPMGRMREQRLSESLLEYQAYVTDFLNQDYTLEITDVSYKKDEANTRYDYLIDQIQVLSVILVIIPIISVLSFVVVFLLLIKKRLLHYLDLGKTKKAQIIQSYNVWNAIEVFTFLGIFSLLYVSRLFVDQYRIYYSITTDIFIVIVVYLISLSARHAYFYIVYRNIISNHRILTQSVRD